ncbi:endonuclease domain-containing protein [Streptomyces parvus]|uniref:endonuclease domain-containing protein n=1 Tax=Streptomyces parvus TaxID=66428 RepID=UPI0033C6FDBD
MSPEVLAELEAKPCEVCDAPPPEAPKHNNAAVRSDTGAVVGTICQRCTKALGGLNHSPERLLRAYALLSRAADLR